MFKLGIINAKAIATDGMDIVRLLSIITVDVLDGRRPAYHLLNEYHSDTSNFPFHIVNFSDLHTIPYTFLDAMRQHIQTRLRLQSPYLEQTAQRFGSYFSRIGLPQDIDKDRVKAFWKNQ